jgi:hypothetical protein
LRAKRTKAVLPAPPDAVECSPSDRAALTRAYKGGLLVAWKHDAERGYRLTFGDKREEYVKITDLPRYLAKLNGTA